MHRDGRILAASPMALASGVEAGQTTGRVQARCTLLQLVPQDIARETLA